MLLLVFLFPRPAGIEKYRCKRRQGCAGLVSAPPWRVRVMPQCVAYLILVTDSIRST